MAAPNEGLDDSLGELPPTGGGGDPGEDDPVIEPFGTNLTGDLASRLQALAFGIGSFDTATGTVTIQRTTDSWMTLDRTTGAFTLVKPGCANGTGTITTTWNGNELDVTLVGQMCSFEGTLIPVDFGLSLAVGPQPGEVQFKLAGDSTVMVQNVGRFLIEADLDGSYVRPAAVAIEWLGKWDDLIGMTAVMVATLDGNDIYHPDYEPPPPPPPSQSVGSAPCENPGPDYDQCVDDCFDFYNFQIELAQQALADAEANLVSVTIDANYNYGVAKLGAKEARKLCLDSVMNSGLLGIGISGVVAGVAIIVTGGAAAPAIAAFVGVVGTDVLILNDATNAYETCWDTYDSTVTAARQIRDLRIEGARSSVDAAEESLLFLLEAEDTCLTDCCPPVTPDN